MKGTGLLFRESSGRKALSGLVHKLICPVWPTNSSNALSVSHTNVSVKDLTVLTFSLTENPFL